MLDGGDNNDSYTNVAQPFPNADALAATPRRMLLRPDENIAGAPAVFPIRVLMPVPRVRRWIMR